MYSLGTPVYSLYALGVSKLFFASIYGSFYLSIFFLLIKSSIFIINEPRGSKKSILRVFKRVPDRSKNLVGCFLPFVLLLLNEFAFAYLSKKKKKKSKKYSCKITPTSPDKNRQPYLHPYQAKKSTKESREVYIWS